MRKWINISAVCVALLLLFSSVSAISQQDIDNRTNEIGDILSKSSTAYIAVAIAILIAALMYMGASVFSDPKLLAFSKDTFYQAIVSLVLIASLPVLYSIISQLVIELFFGGMQIDGGMFDISKILLFWNYVYFFVHLLALTMLNMTVNSLINQTYTIPIGGPLISINLSFAAKPLMYAIGLGVNILTTSLMINSFQLLFINLVESSILSIFLPLGVILRAFPSSMNAGNILIALSIGAYIITPAVYAFDIYLLSKIAESYKGKTGLLASFYSKDTIKSIMGINRCPYFNNIVDKFIARDYSIFGSIDAEEMENECGIAGLDIVKNIPNIWTNLPAWAKVAVSAKVLESAANTILSFKFTKTSKVGTVLKFTSSVSSLAVGAVLMLYVYDILEEVAISFIIISAILPFLNFTIIILFMRDFSLTVLGTPLNLGHLVRLI